VVVMICSFILHDANDSIWKLPIYSFFNSVSISLNLINIKVTRIPKENPTSEETVEVVRCQAGDLAMKFRAFYTAQAAFDAGKIVPDFHPARAISSRMNLRTCREVR